MVRFVSIALSFGVLVLTGCTRPMPWQPATANPTTSDVRTTWKEREQNWRTSETDAAASDDWIPPAEFVATGYLRTRRLCGDFFEQMARARQNTEFARRELGLIGAGTAGVLAAAQASARAIALTAIGFSATDATLANTQELLLFAPVSEQVRRLAFQGMDTVERLVPPSLFTSATERSAPLERFRAEQAVRSHAEACTLPALLTYVTESLAQAEVGGRDEARALLSSLELASAQGAAVGANISIGSSEDAAYLLAGLRLPTRGQPQLAALESRFPGFQGRLLATDGQLSDVGRALRAALQTIAERNVRFEAIVKLAETTLAALVVPFQANLGAGLPPAPKLPALTPSLTGTGEPVAVGGSVTLEIRPRSR